MRMPFKTLLKIYNIIHNWQEIRRRYLSEKKLPLDWAEIGVLLDDPYNVLIRDLVEFPDGRMRGYIGSISAATLKGGQGVAVLPEYQGKILLLYQIRYPMRRWHYEVPRGYGEPNIPADEMLKRKLKKKLVVM